MKFVSQFDTVWKLSDRAHKKLLDQIKRGEDYDLDKLGKVVAWNVESALEMARDMHPDNDRPDDDE